MKIYYYYHKHLPCRTFGTMVGEVLDRASHYWNSMDYDITDISIKAYAVIYTVHRCLKGEKDEKENNN